MNEQVDIFELAKNVPIRDILEKLGFAIKVHSNNREAEITDRKLVSEFNEKWRVNFVKNQVRSYPVDYLPSGGPVRFVRTYLFGSDQSKE